MNNKTNRERSCARVLGETVYVRSRVEYLFRIEALHTFTANLSRNYTVQFRFNFAYNFVASMAMTRLNTIGKFNLYTQWTGQRSVHFNRIASISLNPVMSALSIFQLSCLAKWMMDTFVSRNH